MQKSLRGLIVCAVLIATAAFFMLNRANGSKNTLSYAYPFHHVHSGTKLENEIAFYKKQLSQNPGSAPDRASLASAYLKKARLTSENKWYVHAEKEALKSLTAFPVFNSQAELVLSQVAEARHDFKKAIKIADAVLRSGRGVESALAVKTTSYIGMGKLNQAKKSAALLLSQLPSASSHALYAQVMIAQNKDKKAVEELHDALGYEQPGEKFTSAWIRTLLGQIYARKGEEEKAEKLYRESLRILPDNLMAMASLAELKMSLEHYGEAETLYERAFAVSVQASYLYFLSRVKTMQAASPDAEEYQKRAERLMRKEISQGSFGHRSLLARLLLDRGKTQDVKEALALMKQEIAHRCDKQTLQVYSVALSRSGRFEQAQTIMIAAEGGKMPSELLSVCP